jgi:hypothetical protein
MRIILHELQKIWNLRAVAVLVVLCGMFYLTFMGYYIESYPNGHPHTEDDMLCRTLVQRYGTTLEPDELEEFLQTRDGLVREADGVIASKPKLTALGINDYAGLQKAIESLSHANATEQESLELQTIFEEFYHTSISALPGARINVSATDTALEPLVGYQIEALDSLAQRYENVLDPSAVREGGVVAGVPGEDALYARFFEMTSTGEYRAIIPVQALDNTFGYARSLSLLVVFATLILLAPLLTSDRMGKVHLLQYTAKTGRRILGRQLVAVLISSVALTTALLVVFGALYASTGLQVFWHSDVSSFNTFYAALIRLTFGQLAMVMAGMLYALGLACALLAFVLSRFCSNFIALIAGLIPVAVAGALLCVYIVFERPLNAFMEWGITLLEPYVCLTLLALAATAALCVVRRERKWDVA